MCTRVSPTLVALERIQGITSLGVLWTETHKDRQPIGRIATGNALASGSVIQNASISSIPLKVPRKRFKDALFQVVAAGVPQPHSSAAITDGALGHA